MSTQYAPIGPFVELGPNDEAPDGLELVGDETECSMGDECIGWNGRIANLLGEWLHDPDGVSETVVWSSPWLHPLAPDRPVCEECADWIVDERSDECALCVIGGPPHHHIRVAEQTAPVGVVLVDPEQVE